MTLTEVKLKESIYQENMKKLVSMLYDRLEELTVEELIDLEQAARICGSVYWMEIDRQLEKAL